MGMHFQRLDAKGSGRAEQFREQCLFCVRARRNTAKFRSGAHACGALWQRMMAAVATAVAAHDGRNGGGGCTPQLRRA